MTKPYSPYTQEECWKWWDQASPPGRWIPDKDWNWVYDYDLHVWEWKQEQKKRSIRCSELKRKREDRKSARRCRRVQELMNGLLIRWAHAREIKDWTKADAIRDRMLRHGIRPMAGKERYRWYPEDRFANRTLRLVHPCVMAHWSRETNGFPKTEILGLHA